MEQTAPARQIEVSSAELCTATGFTEHSYSRSTEVTWAFAEWIKAGLLSLGGAEGRLGADCLAQACLSWEN